MTRRLALAALAIAAASGVFIGEPRLDWAVERAATRQACATLTYSVQHRTTSQTLT